MFASIFLYSLANLANGLATSLPAYATLRFIAGIGLAGELGAGITLVSEILHKSIRGYGTMLVASVGVSGAILANLVASTFDWRTAFVIGGVLGLLLLVTRISVAESGMFRAMDDRAGVRRGNFLALFTDRQRFRRYLNSIVIGIPIWFVVGVLITFSPEFAISLGISGPVSAGNAVMFCYLGLIFGDFSSGFLEPAPAEPEKGHLHLHAADCGGYRPLFPPDRPKPRFLLRGLRPPWLCRGATGRSSSPWRRSSSAPTCGPRWPPPYPTSSGAWWCPSPRFSSLAAIISAWRPAPWRWEQLCLVAAFLALAGLEETFHKDLDYFEEYL